MIEQLVWAFKVTDMRSLVLPVFSQVAVCVLLYQFDYIYQLIRLLVRRTFNLPDSFQPGLPDRPAILVVMPTLLRNVSELRSLCDSIESAAANEYPGPMLLVAGIDDRESAPRLYSELCSWIEKRAESWPSNVTVKVTGTNQRRGKALAVESAVCHVRELVARGEYPAVPGIFFNMDADGTLGPHALERMVYRLTKRNRITKEPGYIVAGNVAVRREHYWRGFSWFFTVQGQIALQIAREFMVTSGVGRHNTKVLPVVGVPGALYCTWTFLYEQGPRYAAFIRTLRWRDWVRWWFGGRPPLFSEANVEPLPEAMTGPGDDTWVAWLASSARWSRGHLTLDFPRTPAHALFYFLRNYFIHRSVAYDVRAKVFTVSPTRPSALLRQRVRWNACRPDTLGRWWRSMIFHWQIGIPSTLQLLITVVVVGLNVVGLLMAPLVAGGGFVDLAVAYLLAFVAHVSLFAVSTLIAFAVDEDWSSLPKLLAIPLAPTYFFVFNLLPCLYGLVCDILLFGSWTNFSPEETLIRSRTTRIALVFRLRRFLTLATRALVSGDVPFGMFWFGWRESSWTYNGFTGWTSGKKRSWWPKLTPTCTPSRIAARVTPIAHGFSSCGGQRTETPRWRSNSIPPAQVTLPVTESSKQPNNRTQRSTGAP